MEIRGSGRINARIRLAQGRIGEPDRIHPRKRRGPVGHAVIVVRHGNVAPVPGHVDELDAVQLRNGVEGDMGLDRTAMLLRLEPGHDLLDAAPVHLEPGKQAVEGHRLP